MGKSIVQETHDCFLCGRETCLERHHIMAGPNRHISERWGIWVYLCHGCHTGTEGAQYNKELNQYLKKQAQMAFEEKYSHEEWMELFRKNYL